MSSRPPHLIVITGPSHAGKTAVAEALMSQLPRSAALVRMDDILDALHFAEGGDRWELGLDIAYDVATATADQILAHDVSVLLESTFTLVRNGAPAELHLDRLDAFAHVASTHDAEFDVVLLTAALEDVRRRRDETGRLSDEIVTAIWAATDGSDLYPTRTIRVPSAGDPQRVAQRIADLLDLN